MAGRYDNPIPTPFLASIECLTIPALFNIWTIGAIFRTLASGQTQVKVSLLLDNSLKTRPQGMENFKKGEQGKGRLKNLKWEVGSQPGFTLKFNWSVWANSIPVSPQWIISYLAGTFLEEKKHR